MYGDAALLFPIGLPEILFILLLVVLIFGAKRLPEIGRGLGEGIKNFRKGIKSPDKDQPADKQSDDNSKNT